MKTIANEISCWKEVGSAENSYQILGQKYVNTLFNLTTDKLIYLLLCFFICMLLLLIISLNAFVKVIIESNSVMLSIHLMCGAGTSSSCEIMQINRQYVHAELFRNGNTLDPPLILPILLENLPARGYNLKGPEKGP